MNPKLNATVSVVKISENILEFFKTNTRQQVHIRVKDDTIMNIVCALDGSKNVDALSLEYGVKKDDLIALLGYLRKKGILDNIGNKDEFDNYDRFRRCIHFIAEYSVSHEDLLEMWNNISKSTVLIVGLGAVGSWVAANLVQSGIKKIILMDADVVEVSNLHRQFGYSEEDIGKKKVDVLADRLHQYNPALEVVKIESYLDEFNLYKFDDIDIDLIINCADKPNVDTTSLWIGEYGMKRNIPHIIGGGYNFHLSLIGQTVIPGKTACVNCFRKQLEEENKIDPKKVKKLAVKNRKVGSFGPMCSLIASMIGMEAIKILSKKITPANTNRRGEFDIYTMKLQYKTYKQRRDCEWCGENGKYYSPSC
ncbi:ThiF family adenylyltransferase [Phascolarctobacterium succinatutens]|uniref:HesA/MoeB/ThiF family protein n=1 Tax=Phascolarctobacterium succinatutens TaxID=626940 RepID=UPI0026EE1AB5|nr:ThiF family adenylyltransferase [Phascolarctobacterium succinatutens]